MTDTPQHIQELQLKIWLSKSPGERLRQFLVDNDALYKAIVKAKEQMGKEKPA
ncbi:MAG: hypothetical protein H7Z13_13850 [Ferruginibacter sp.]|nr:hypothetical protein [Ferruginibacter sp.]